MSYRLDYAIAQAVERDGLPRQAMDLNGSGTTHVLYRENGLAHSMLADVWLAQRGALPADPTPAEIAAALAAQQQQDQQARTDAAQLRQQVLTLANSAAGVRVDALTAPQVRALVSLLLWQAGALNKDGTVRPLADWIDRPAGRRT